MSRPARPSHERRPLRVGVLGAGTVGREVVRALLDRPRRAAAGRTARALELAAIAVRDVDRAAARGPAGGAAVRCAGPPRRRRRDRRHRRADGRRRAGPHADRRRAVDGQAASSPPTSTSSPTTGRSSRRSPGGPARRCASRPRSAAGSRSSGRWPATSRRTASSASAGIVNGTTNFILTRDDRRGRAARLRGGAGRGPAARATPRPTRRATSRGSTRSTSW